MKRGFLYLTIALIFSTPVMAVDDAHYRIGEGDIVRITVYDNPDLETQARVGTDGTVHFPLIGTIRIGGKSVAEAAETIAGRLAEGYLVNPQVSIFVEEFSSQKAVIMGQVKNPGLYELSGQTTILQLISKAGGVTEDADETVTIKRRSGTRGEEQIITVNLRALMEKGDSSQDVPVLDGDNIRVNKAGVFFVTGEVRRPDSYKLESGTTVITAVTKAGGFTELASKRKIRIIRKVNGDEEVLNKVPMHTLVQPNDVIVVPESFF